MRYLFDSNACLLVIYQIFEHFNSVQRCNKRPASFAQQDPGRRVKQEQEASAKPRTSLSVNLCRARGVESKGSKLLLIFQAKAQANPDRFSVVAAVASLAGVGAYAGFVSQCRSKNECNTVHSYAVIVPVSVRQKRSFPGCPTPNVRPDANHTT